MTGSAVDNINLHDRYAGILGILPHGLPDLVCPNPQSLGLSERHHKRVTKANGMGLASLRLTILKAARRIFERWYGHAVSYFELATPRAVPPEIVPPSVSGGVTGCLDSPACPDRQQNVATPVVASLLMGGTRRRRLANRGLPSRPKRAIIAGKSLTGAVKPRAVKKRKPLKFFGGLALKPLGRLAK